MANPRRTSNSGSEAPQTQYLSFSSVVYFLKKPQAFPFLLSIFVFLTWVSLRFQQPNHVSSSQSEHSSEQGRQWKMEADRLANLVRFSSRKFPSDIIKDERGWLLNPVTLAQQAGISGGAQSCVSVHLGEIRPGAVRGNHRHRSCNETFVFWGAETKFRLENEAVVGKSYSEVTIGPEEVAVAASPSGTAHALINTDPSRNTFFLGCQDGIVSYNQSDTDFHVWKDI
ncbi:hypothetical protein H6P81_007833 [Aristolochia fimbriata]|uniref:Uncharacterized protein n=1 Tax=Aristolochia fimbriata TaxID=158543 RepID=A0AAV7F2P0_ARIFI|nr:hypothetical protein H6P81_007833 [Aristolochia fimbriata]